MSAIDDIASVGANTLAIIVTGYQDDVRTPVVAADPGRTPTEASVAAAVAHARTRGLRVVIKPHVDVNDGSWRGTINPEDPDAWFKSYGDFVEAWARFAQTSSVEQFIVGTELAGTLDHEGSWRELMGRIRGVYSGELIYAASWDEMEIVPFWDTMDKVGVDFYGSVTSRAEPGRLEILEGWQVWLERLHQLSSRAGKEIILTEIGYRSVDGAGRRPYQFDDGATFDAAEQADLYWAAMEATGNKDWIEGMYWWNWLADGSGGTGNTDYTPKSKPAEGELQNAWTN